jgi:alkylhydroperoxidase family enzyme
MGMADPMTLARELERAVLASPGTTSADLRRAVAARSAALGGRPGAERATGEIPAALAPYVDKVARHAYQVTEADLAVLARAGLSEDAIFEVTVAAAAGAGLARLERGLAALRGDEP